MSLAVREVSVAKGYDPRDFALVASGGAGPLHVCAIARELLHPDRDRAAVSLALLRARHAARRRAPRFHPHGLFRSRQRRFRQARRGARRDGRGGRRPSLRHGKDAQYQIQSRHALCRAGVHAVGAGRACAAQARRPQGDPHRLRPALRAALRAPFARGAGRDGQHPARRHRQAAEARVPEPCGGRRGRAVGRAPGLFHAAPSKPLTAKVYRRDAFGRRRARSPGPR